MRSYCRQLLPCIAALVLSCAANAEVIDPEKHIQQYGYHSTSMGDDGKTPFFSYVERTTLARVKTLELEIETLPKDAAILKLCDFLRAGVKAKLIEERHLAYDVAVTNFGYRGPIMVCVLKFMYQDKVGTQLSYRKQGKLGWYTVMVTD